MESARQHLHSLARHVLKNTKPEEAVVLAWPLVCGSTVAARARAVRFENGILHIAVPDREWRAQLEAFSAHYLHKLTALAGVAVKRLSYDIGSDSPSAYTR